LALVWDRDGSTIDASWVKEGTYQVNVGGILTPVTVSLRPLFDPDGERIRR
jgi:4-methylaminobutanoate oxidase (formaldehyde-forming)